MRWLALLLLGASVLAGCGGGDGGGSSNSSGTPLRTIALTEKEFSISPGKISVAKSGTYSFTVTNKGSIAHALELEGNGAKGETEHIQPGSSATLTVDISKSGSFELYCPIDGHKDQGMKATLVVGAASGSGGAGTTTDDSNGGTTTDKQGGGYGY